MSVALFASSVELENSSFELSSRRFGEVCKHFCTDARHFTYLNVPLQQSYGSRFPSLSTRMNKTVLTLPSVVQGVGRARDGVNASSDKAYAFRN